MNSKQSTGVLDIPRQSNKRQRQVRRIIYLVVGLAAIAGITIFLSRLKPASPIVDKATIWVDTVKRGPMVTEVRGLGALVPQTKGAKAASKITTAQLKIPEAQAKDVRTGQSASIDTRNGVVPGHVVRVDRGVVEGTVKVDVKLDGPLLKGARPDLGVDGTIEIENLKDAIYVGRPVFGQPNSTLGMFKLDEDGKGASLVQVRLGRASANSIEILSGLQPADKVVTSDMSAWDAFNRIRLE
jgi:multidrug efflux pump subunit AcrA (membrane-fusion protein)